MRAALYNGVKNIVLTELKTDFCGDNDILLKNIYASICGSDVSIYNIGLRAKRVAIGGEFGHEMVSEVVEVGKNVKDILIGDRVYPYPRPAKGDPKRIGCVGGFSENVLIPNAQLNKQVFKVSDKISSKAACLIEPFTVATRGARRAQPKPDETAIVFGAGGIGTAAAIALKYFGCKQVMVVDVSDLRLEIAKKLGFEICNFRKEDLKAKATEIFGEARAISGPTANVDIYIDAVGVTEIIETFMAMAKIESRLVIIGAHSELATINLLLLSHSRNSLIGSGGYEAEDVIDVMAMMESGNWHIESIITHEFPWEQLVNAFETASDVNKALKVIIRY